MLDGSGGGLNIEELEPPEFTKPGDFLFESSHGTLARNSVLNIVDEM